jgi:outer membrane receptor for ferric coprogen and ferric-rhodotorulic acid
MALGRQQTLAILQALLSAGRINQSFYDSQAFNWNAAIIDTVTSGYELELIANPTKRWTVRANYSRSSRDRENFFAEGRAYFAQRFPEWRNLAGSDATLRNTVETNIASIESEISDRSAAQEQGFGSIPHKATITSRYRFTEGRLAGAFAGGAVRYQSKVYAQQDTRAPSAGGTGREYWANESIYADAFLGWRFRLPWNPRLHATWQLNVRNLTNSYLVTTARWNSDFSGARRIYLREPRSWRMTGTVEF